MADAAVRDATSPPWLAEAATALGMVRRDGVPLALNWTQMLEAIRGMRAERDALRKRVKLASHALNGLP
jgi:hypothetical protein